MPKSEPEKTAVLLAKQHWAVYAGCTCMPAEEPKGKGYDLGCPHRHVEVKGTAHSHPGFRLLTAGEFDAARRDHLFELWLVTGIEGGTGSVASQYTDPQTGNQYNILVRLDSTDRNRIDDIDRLTVPSTTGQLVKLGTIAQVVVGSTPVEIDRKYQQRIIDVTANVTGRDLGSVSSDIQTKLSKLSVPTGFQVVQAGNIEQQKSTFKSLLLALLLAIVMVYMVMASQFQSLVDPFIIMFTVPLGLAGVVWALFLTNTSLSVNSFEGIIVMVGIVVSNGILLIDYINRLRKRGVELHEAVTLGGRTRLRPILMTSLATVLGLLPMALGMGGDTSQAPLAIAVIGGLTVSTFLTLIFVPTLYTVFEERFKREIKQEAE